MGLSKAVVLKDVNLAAGLVVKQKCSKLSVVCSDLLWDIEIIQLLESRPLCVGGWGFKPHQVMFAGLFTLFVDRATEAPLEIEAV